MSRPKGLPKTGGRVRGTLNKKSLALMAKLEFLGCDPIEGMATIANNPETTPELRVRCYAELAQYVYPKRKAIDLSGDPENQGQIRIVVRHIGSSQNGKPSL